MAGLIRVYGQWDNYRTSFDDFQEVYLFGIQDENDSALRFHP